MYLGQIMESGPSDEVFREPRHPYTRALLSAVPKMTTVKRQRAAVTQGEIPSPLNIPSGCRFRTRCPLAQDICAHEEPVLAHAGRAQQVACHFPLSTPESPVSIPAKA
jgi:oligopeptide/dipeptide ABC transporter ATP-binding protein